MFQMNRPHRKCISRSKKLRKIKHYLLKWREDLRILDRCRQECQAHNHDRAKEMIRKDAEHLTNKYIYYYNQACTTIIYCSTKTENVEEYCILCTDSINVQETIVLDLELEDILQQLLDQRLPLNEV